MTKVFDAIVETLHLVKGEEIGVLAIESQIKSLELDSLDEVEVMMALEERFDIEIDQAMISGCATLGDLQNVIQSLLNKN